MRPRAVPAHISVRGVSKRGRLGRLITTDGAEPQRCGTAKGGLIVKFLKQSLSLLLSWCLVLATAPEGFASQAGQPAAAAPAQSAATQSTTAPVQSAQQTPEQLQQMVAPVALYPDALVAQILAAATYP